MVNEQMKWHCELHVVRCEGWEREMLYPDTKRQWVMPSMGIPRFETALLYGGTCLFEGTNLSEGRGTTAPFEIIGAPFIEAEQLAQEMNQLSLPGVRFRPVYFQPSLSKFQDELCRGVQLHITNYREIRPLEVGIRMLFIIQQQYESFSFLPPLKEGSRPFIDLLCGDRIYRDPNVNVDALLEQFRSESEAFAHMKQQYHLYGR